jgi:hypothetical protein
LVISDKMFLGTRDVSDKMFLGISDTSDKMFLGYQLQHQLLVGGGRRANTGYHLSPTSVTIFWKRQELAIPCRIAMVYS